MEMWVLQQQKNTSQILQKKNLTLTWGDFSDESIKQYFAELWRANTTHFSRGQNRYYLTLYLFNTTFSNKKCCLYTSTHAGGADTACVDLISTATTHLTNSTKQSWSESLYLLCEAVSVCVWLQRVPSPISGLYLSHCNMTVCNIKASGVSCEAQAYLDPNISLVQTSHWHARPLIQSLSLFAWVHGPAALWYKQQFTSTTEPKSSQTAHQNTA